MTNMLNLDPVIRKVNGPISHLAPEEVLVTIDLTSTRAIEKTFLVRLGSNFQDYLVANNKNLTRTAEGKLATHYVRDAQHERTLALQISIMSASCPPRHEAQLAAALHSEQSPGAVFTAMVERWVKEFIPPGDESRFIDAYDSVRRLLETHIAERSAATCGLKVLPKVALSGETTVAPEIIVGPIEIGVRLNGYTDEQKITVEAGLELDAQHYVKAFVFQESLPSPEELFKRSLKEYFFKQVTFQQFTQSLHYPNFKQTLIQSLSTVLKQIGRHVRFINFSPDERNIKGPSELVRVTYDCEYSIHGRSQPVLIQNTVQLYCEGSDMFLASKIGDLEDWAKTTLNVALKRHLMGRTYVDLLLRFAPIEQDIKRELSARAAYIGYRVDHLVSIPSLKEMELTKPFPLEIDGRFETKLDNFEVQLKFNIKLCIPKLDSVEKYLNPGIDVKEAIKEMILSEAGQCLRKIPPERFYLYFNHANEAATTTAGAEDERIAVRELLNKRIQDSLRREFVAKIFDLTLRVGRTDLTERYHNLCHVIRVFEVTIDSPDPQATENLTLTGNFELRGVYPDSDGWQRFSVLRLDLEALKTQLETHLRAELKTYYQSSFMFQNQLGRQQVFSLVRNFASGYMREEFGLMIHLTNLDRNTTGAEERQRQLLVDLENNKLTALVDQSELLVDNLKTLRRKRVNVMSVFPIDQATLEEVDENIRRLEAELHAISSSRFGHHRLGAALEGKSPDELPPADFNGRSVLESKPKGHLAG